MNLRCLLNLLSVSLLGFSVFCLKLPSVHDVFTLLYGCSVDCRLYPTHSAGLGGT